MNGAAELFAIACFSVMAGMLLVTSALYVIIRVMDRRYLTRLRLRLAQEEVTDARQRTT